MTITKVFVVTLSVSLTLMAAAQTAPVTGITTASSETFTSVPVPAVPPVMAIVNFYTFIANPSLGTTLASLKLSAGSYDITGIAQLDAANASATTATCALYDSANIIVPIVAMSQGGDSNVWLLTLDTNAVATFSKAVTVYLACSTDGGPANLVANGAVVLKAMRVSLTKQ